MFRSWLINHLNVLYVVGTGRVITSTVSSVCGAWKDNVRGGRYAGVERGAFRGVYRCERLPAVLEDVVFSRTRE